jgi:fibronectin type III domain protein
MSKKRINQSGKGKRAAPDFKTRKLAIMVLMLFVALAGSALTHWRVMRPAHRPLATANSAPLALSKEYIYAGDRLIATEEPPGNGSTLPTPVNLAATTVSGYQINVTWTALAGSVDHYQVERSQSVNGPYVRLTPDPSTNAFSDTGVTSGIAYLYRVRAVDASGRVSPESNIDLATAITFADDPLITFAEAPTGANVTPIKAQHWTDLRVAVNAVRATAGLPQTAWSGVAQPGASIQAAHLQELRSNLDQALSALGLTTSPYTDPTLSSSVSVKAVHLRELRQRMK